MNTTQKPETEPVTQGETAIRNAPPSLDDLLCRGQRLLDELEIFRKHASDVETSKFKNFIEMDLKFLKKAKKDNTGEIDEHQLRSCNTPFAEALWDTAKRSCGVIALKRSCRAETPNPKNSNVIIDIVAQKGLEWIKISTITQSNLLIEMAREGWSSLDSSEEESGPPSGTTRDDMDTEISILKTTNGLLRAARATRLRYQHPKVRLVLPRLFQGHVAEIDTLLDRIRSNGVQIQTANELVSPEPNLNEVLTTMTANYFSDFSETLNIDCTILLALVSDVSHGRVAKEHWHHRFLKQQIDAETEDKLLPTTLYPTMGSHSLVCTSIAAMRMKEIVKTLGTDTEQLRTSIMLSDSPDPDCKAEAFDSHEDTIRRLDQFQSLSEYPVPRNWQLPIRVVDEGPDSDCSASPLPALAALVMSRLSGKTDINRSVLLYGWRTGRTTLTSNRAIVKELEKLVEDTRSETNEEDAVGPDIWLCANARSLVGKEKTRRGAGGEEG